MAKTYLLLVHGNGGAETRFDLFLPRWAQACPAVIPVIPRLPGFGERPIAADADWPVFIAALGVAVQANADATWILYGHGIGGSLLLEWAKHGYPLPNGQQLSPERVMLHAPVGASLEQRWFPKLMQPKIFRHFIHWLIYQPWLQARWERKLFLFPERIPAELKRQFFADYRTCTAFPIFFDLITPDWYKSLFPALRNADFHFIWGEKERVIASKFLALWQKDFPQSTFEVIPAWDHFPMLEQVEDFTEKMRNLVGQCQ